MDARLAKTLYLWAIRKPDNQSLLDEWLDKCILEIAAGNGSQPQSVSSNGVSVSFGGQGLSFSAYANTLSLAISYLDNPPRSISRGRIV